MRAAAFLLVAILTAACGPRRVVPEVRESVASITAPHVEPLPGTRLLLVPHGVPPGSGPPPRVIVEVAATTQRRQRGLAGRETLRDGAGMLFVYATARERLFWMKDCLIGLDIAFLDADGTILEIATLPPGSGLVGEDVPSTRCEGPVLYVLEVRAGWLGEQGITVGDVVDVRWAVDGVVPE